ncbi:MAG: amino acid permease [Terrisporobacter sp.]|uniref:APC family permease n=1 Tax=Terrisporobacter sp. TaxID=1965305 RepID=UPI002FCB06E1
MGQNLQKNLGLSAALSTVIGMVIGAGVFFKPQAVYNLTGGAPGLGILSWILAGMLTIAGGLTAAEVSAAIPKTGGMMVYIEEIYGEKLGFLTGWMQSVLFFPAMIAALSVMFGQQVAYLFNNPSLSLPFTIGVILFLAMMNNLGSKTSGIIQTVSTICKLIPLIILIILGFVKGDPSSAAIMTPMVGEGVSPMGIIGQLMIAVLFAYDGWMNVGAIAGEMKNPGKDLPRAIVGGLTAVMSVYIIINIAYLCVLPANTLATFESPASAVAEMILGPIGGKLITSGILISLFGCVNGYILTGSRSLYTLGMKELIPGSKFIKKLNKQDTPAYAIAVIVVISIVYSLSGQFNLLTDLAMFSVWAFYVLTFYGVIKLRKDNPGLHRPYKVPMYPFIPIVAMSGGLFVIINQLFFAGSFNRILSVGSIIITLLGLPVYNYYNKLKENDFKAKEVI